MILVVTVSCSEIVCNNGCTYIPALIPDVGNDVPIYPHPYPIQYTHTLTPFSIPPVGWNQLQHAPWYTDVGFIVLGGGRGGGGSEVSYNIYPPHLQFQITLPPTDPNELWLYEQKWTFSIKNYVNMILCVSVIMQFIRVDVIEYPKWKVRLSGISAWLRVKVDLQNAYRSGVKKSLELTT